MKTVQIIESKYCPWDDMVWQDSETGGYGCGSELYDLKADQMLRVVKDDVAWQDIGKTLFGWWAEHLVAEALLDIFECTRDDMAQLRASARQDYELWLDTVEMSDLNEALHYLLWDDIRSLLPDTHEWEVIDGWYCVYPKCMEEKGFRNEF